jgi:hypothetical protein
MAKKKSSKKKRKPVPPQEGYDRRDMRAKERKR